MAPSAFINENKQRHVDRYIGDGRTKPRDLLLITAELERCLEGESKVMVPKAGHGTHSDNPTFYSQAVMAFLQQR